MGLYVCVCHQNGILGLLPHTAFMPYRVCLFLCIAVHGTPSCCTLPLDQAKALGDVLVVGLIPDSEIRRCKGPPVLNERERYLLVDAVKWVDEVVQGDKGLLQGC